MLVSGVRRSWEIARSRLERRRSRAGENVLELTVTGSLANRYGGAEIPYGLLLNGVPVN